LFKKAQLTRVFCKSDAGGGCGGLGWVAFGFAVSPGNNAQSGRPLIDVMPIHKVRFWDPEHWRFRAEETRTVADQMTHEEARAIMRRIANDYDRLAKLAEQQLADQERRATGDKT
jgi:hypothetical protein